MEKKEVLKLWPVYLPTSGIKYQQNGSDVVFDNNSVLFGYTIRIPKDVYDNALKCSRSSKIINSVRLSEHGSVYRNSNHLDGTVRCYFKLTFRLPYQQVKDFYEQSSTILTGLKQTCMIKSRQLKELYSESERQSLEKGEMTTKRVNQLKLQW